MPHSPHNWADLLNNLPPEIGGFLMAIVMSFLRILYDGQDTKPLRIVVESLICGALSLTASSAIVALDLNINWAMFCGGIIGYLGSATIRTIALRVIRKKTEN